MKFIYYNSNDLIILPKNYKKKIVVEMTTPTPARARFAPTHHVASTLRNMSDFRNEASRSSNPQHRQAAASRVLNAHRNIQSAAHGQRNANSSYWNTPQNFSSHKFINTNKITNNKSTTNYNIDHGMLINPNSQLKHSFIQRNRQKQTTKSNIQSKKQNTIHKFVHNTKTRLRGIAYDLKHWKQLPQRTISEKLKFVFMRDDRHWSIIGLIFVAVVILCIGMLIYYLVRHGLTSTSNGNVSNDLVASSGPVVSSTAPATTTSAASSPKVETANNVLIGGYNTLNANSESIDDLMAQLHGGHTTVNNSSMTDLNSNDWDSISGAFPFIEFD